MNKKTFTIIMLSITLGIAIGNLIGSYSQVDIIVNIVDTCDKIYGVHEWYVDNYSCYPIQYITLPADNITLPVRT